MEFTESRDLTMFDKFVWPTNTYDVRIDIGVVEEFDDGGAKPINQDMILKGADDLSLLSKTGDRVCI